MKRAIVWKLCPLLLFAGIGAGCNSSDMMSTQEEVDIGRQAAAQVEQENRVDTDPRLNRRVQIIGRRLAAVSDRKDVTFIFKILDINEVNAVSLPGGWIYVYRPLLDRIGGDDNQLAGVLGHEVGHVSARHQAQMIVKQQLYGTAIGVLLQGKQTPQEIASVFANLQLLKYSRDDEYQADQLGALYTYRTGIYDPEGLVRFLRGLEAGGGSSSRLQSYFNTHPDPADRVQRLEAYISRLRSGRP